MKIFEFKKNKTERYFKLFGITIYKNLSKEREQFILNGLISIKKEWIPKEYIKKKEIKILNHSLIKLKEDGDYCYFYIFNKLIKKQRAIDYYGKKLVKYIENKHDDIYIFSANSGETFIFLTYFADAFIKKHSSKKPLFICLQKYLCELVKMIYPEIPCIYIKTPFMFVKQEPFIYKNKRFFRIFNITFLEKAYKKIKDETIPCSYFKLQQEELNISDEEIKIKPIKISKEVEESMNTKVKEIGLNIDNFIFIAPEAKSCLSADNDFWINIINEFHEKGYDIFMNLNDNKVHINEVEYKSSLLTLSEGFALAKRAKKIITLRSGFAEILSQSGVDMDVIYTDKGMYRTFQISKHIPLYNSGKINDILIPENASREDMMQICKKITILH